MIVFGNYRTDRCCIIAEIGGNFTTLDQAKRLIDAAHGCGVDAVKLQTYRADTITSTKAIFDMENTGVVSQHDFFRKYEVNEALHHGVFKYAESKGLDWFSTPSHATDVELLETRTCNPVTSSKSQYAASAICRKRPSISWHICLIGLSLSVPIFIA